MKRKQEQFRQNPQFFFMFSIKYIPGNYMPDVDKVKGNYVENNRAREEESDMRGGERHLVGLLCFLLL